MDISLSTLSSTQGFRILGESSSDQSGVSVKYAGDFNGDGYADIIIGAPWATSSAGKSYVIFGKASGFSDINLSTLSSTQGFRILGESSNDQSGISVSSAGDVNKDGYADVIIGAYGATSSTGKSYVIFGKASGFSDISLSTLSSTQGFRILGESSGDYSGFSVSSAGDVNGDGYADIIIGAFGASSRAGKSYVIFGKANSFSEIDLRTLSNSQGFRILGESNNDISGRSVSSTGDVNGDGYADIIIGAPNAISNAGKSYVIFGKASGFSDINLSTLSSTQGFRILGESSNDQSGISVSSAGDVNKDGYEDIIIGAYAATSNTGKSYVIFGKANGFSDISLSTLSSTQGFRILGENSGDYSGISVSSAEDVNKDGYADIIIGTPYPLNRAGKSYVIFGKASGFSDINLGTLSSTQGFRILGESSGDRSGTVSSAGDVNKDGYADIIIGAWSASGGAGKSYVIFGGVPLLVMANNTISTYGIIPTLTVSYSGFVDSEGPTDLTVQPSVTTTATITSNPSNYTITASGGVSGKYRFYYKNGMLTINKAELQVTANSAITTYGAIPPLTESYNGFVNSEGPSNLITQPIVSTIATITSSPGSYTITVSGGVSDNYAFKYVNGILTIDKAALQITANSVGIVYGQTLPTLTIKYNGFVNSEGPSNLLTEPTILTTATPTSSAGGYPIIVSRGVSNNYAFNYVNGTLTINKAPLQVTANSLTTTYGTNPVLTESYNGFVKTEGPSNLINKPIASTTATATSSAGLYTITVSGGESINYAFSYVEGRLTIKKAPLYVIAGSNTISYGETIPTFTARYVGFVNSESPSNLLTKPTISTTATAKSNAGSYTIKASDGESDNYAFDYIDGILTINKAPLNVTAKNIVTTYGSIPTCTETYSGFVNFESPSNLIIQPRASTTATATSSPGSYPITVSAGVSYNYDMNYFDGTLTINKAPLKVTANNATAVYQTTLPTFTITYSGFVNKEHPFSLITQPIATSTATAFSNPGIYEIIPSGGKSDNYDFVYEKGYLTIEAAETPDPALSSWEKFVKYGVPVLSVFGTLASLAYTIRKCKKQGLFCFKAAATGTAYVKLAELPSGINASPNDDMYENYNIFDEEGLHELNMIEETPILQNIEC